MACPRCDQMTGSVRGVEYCWRCMAPASALGSWAKPATTEPPECKLDWPGKDQGFAMGTADKPPEWKGPTDTIDTIARIINARGEHWFGPGNVCVKCVKPCADSARVCPAMPLTESAAVREAADYLARAGRIASPLDRALEDFTARRKAKRERAEALERAGAHIPYAETTRINKVASDIARAMQQPAPHDPDIHTRLMPWRGK